MGGEGRGIFDPEIEILIVDDNQQYSFLLSRTLQGAFGYRHVTSLFAAEPAFDLIKAEPGRFKLLFIDYQFPSGMSGGDLLRMLALHGLLKGKAAFLITSEPTTDNVGEAMAAGALGVVAKPFDREALKKQLDKAQRALEVESAESF